MNIHTVYMFCSTRRCACECACVRVCVWAFCVILGFPHLVVLTDELICANSTKNTQILSITRAIAVAEQSIPPGLGR